MTNGSSQVCLRHVRFTRCHAFFAFRRLRPRVLSFGGGCRDLLSQYTCQLHSCTFRAIAGWHCTEKGRHTLLALRSDIFSSPRFAVANAPAPVSPRGSAPRLELFLFRVGRTAVCFAVTGPSLDVAVAIGDGGGSGRDSRTRGEGSFRSGPLHS